MAPSLDGDWTDGYMDNIVSLGCVVTDLLSGNIDHHSQSPVSRRLSAVVYGSWEI